MIHVVKEKRLNDFKFVRCVKAKDLFARLGNRVPDTSFESSDEPIPLNMSKIDSIEYLQRYDERLQYEAQRESAGADASPQGDDSSSDANVD